jgi:phage protein D
LTGSVQTGIVSPTVSVGPMGAMPLNPMVEPLLIRTVVDTSLHRPDMFELTFVDSDGMLLDLTMIDIGTEIKIEVGQAPMATTLMVGEVTSIEGDYEHLLRYTIIRGYEHSHRLQRARRSRTFLDSTDGDVATRIAGDADIGTGDIQDPGVTHRYIAQVAQTDWEFLKGRAAEIGYEVGVSEGDLYFRPAPGMSAGGLGGAASAAASAVGLGGCTLSFGENLRWLRPRVSSAGLTPEAEVRVWDPESKGVVSAVARLESETADVDDDPVTMSNAYGGPLSLPAIPSIPGLPSFLGASANAHASIDRPLGWGSTTQSEADAMAAGMAEHVASTYAEAEGSAMATPELVAGAKVTLENVPDRFAGDWNVTSARHEFDNAEGYNIRFEVSGRHERSLHGLLTGGRLDRRSRGLIDGLVPGVVTNNIDEDGMYRVKVALPWLSPDFETDWARVAMPGLGATYGMVAIPEVGDEVLVGFEFGDVRRAYVLGGLGNGETELELGGDPVKQGIPGGIVVKRGIVSRLGHKFIIDDDGDGTVPPATSGITIGNEDDTITIQMDDVNKKLTIICDSSGPPASIEIKQNGAGGSVTIEQAGTGGTLDIKGAGNVSVEAAAPGTLSLKGGTGVTIDAGAGMVELKGSMVKLN